MKLSRLLLAAAAVAVAFPFAARADDAAKVSTTETVKVNDDGDRETIEIHKRMRPSDRDEDEREGEPGDRRDDRDGPHGQRERDPEVREKLEKLRDLDHQLRVISKKLMRGTDAEKASAKTAARKVLTEMYDMKVTLNATMIAKMEQHLAELKADVARKKASREKAIEARLARMIGDGDDW